MRKATKKGALFGCHGMSLRNLKAVSIKCKSTLTQNKTKGLTLHSATGYATIPLGGSKTARRLGSLQFNRRMIAAPLRGVFLCAVNRTHGVSLPKTMTGAPYGNPYGLSLPVERSANLYGVAHPLGRGVSFTTDKLATGESHE